MNPISLSTEQQHIVERSTRGTMFLEGISGTGKTTAGAARLLRLLNEGIRADSILVLVPQRILAEPYTRVTSDPRRNPGGQVTIATLGGFARRMIDLFWPVIVEGAGFGNPAEPPLFLTLETAQYYMTQIVSPLLDRERYFESITIHRNRLFSQILDNLNKSAVVGFPFDEIGGRLKEAWVGEPERKSIYTQAQACATRFREACLARNLLDYSLQIQTFKEHLWHHTLFREYIQKQVRHLIVDNLEEDVPLTHDMIQDWIPDLESALLIFDQGGGYRRFLGADPKNAYRLSALCDQQAEFTQSFVMSANLRAFAIGLEEQLIDRPSMTERISLQDVHVQYSRYHPQMLAWAADEIATLIHERGVAPEQIVALAPFMTDALRFSLTELLSQREIPTRSHRPSRALRDEPAAQCLLLLAMLAHPHWGFVPSTPAVIRALISAIEDMDLVRAHLLGTILFRVREGIPLLEPYDQLRSEMRKRITFTLGERYEALRDWIEAYKAGPVLELDYFLRRLFGEVLTQPGYRFRGDYDAGAVTTNLIESVQKFRRVLERELDSQDRSTGKLYVDMVRDGVVASQYIRHWEQRSQEAVLLAPAYTFLMSNHPVDYQFWLEIGSSGWWERLYQPLTHPYVLSRNWTRGELWTDVEEYATRRETLNTLIQGLIHRCRKGIFLGLSELDDDGFDQRGPLLRALQAIFRASAVPLEGSNV